jgi:hypothetical protein
MFPSTLPTVLMQVNEAEIARSVEEAQHRAAAPTRRRRFATVRSTMRIRRDRAAESEVTVRIA